MKMIHSKTIIGFVGFSVTAGLFAALMSDPMPVTAATTSCEELARLSLPNTTVTLAQTVAAGAFIPAPARGGAAAPAGPAAGRGGPQFADLPGFCRVQATLKPSSDSDK